MDRDEIIRRLEGRGVEFVVLGGVNVAWVHYIKGTDTLCPAISQLDGIEQLDFNGSDVSDAGIGNLANMKQLRILDLGNTAITGRGLRVIPELSGLRELRCRPKEYAAEGIEHIARAVQLDDLSLHEMNAAPDEAFVPLRKLVNLKSLGLSLTRVGKAVREFHTLTKLQFLSLEGTHVDDEALATIGHLATLEELFASKTRITDAGMVHLSRLPKLQSLAVSHTHVTSAGLVHLECLPRLETLFVEDIRIDERGLKSLLEIRSLRNLWLNRADISDEQLAVLKKRLPKCDVTVFGGPPKSHDEDPCSAPPASSTER